MVVASKSKTPKMTAKAYEAHKARMRERSRATSAAGREIGAIPPIADHARLSEGERSLRRFCEIYFPMKFNKPWCDDHLIVINKIEAVVMQGLRLAVAMPRGSGKTSLCEAGAIWAFLNGYHRFICIVGSTADYAKAMLDNVKTELFSNERLLADYPAACYPVRCLDNEARRCLGQRHYGQPTNIMWGEDEIVLPTIPGSPCTGGRIYAAGITGNIRGKKVSLPSGENIRPTLAIVDDPQTDESAKSATQTRSRISIINGAISGLAGPGQRTGIIVPCTVVAPGDLADQILDRQDNPEWRGERTKLVYQWPTRTDLWDRYAEIRGDEFRNGGEGTQATEFVRDNFDTMHEGSHVAWKERFGPAELSALQHAYNIRLSDESTFFAEYQNDPLADTSLGDEGTMSADQVAHKLNLLTRGTVTDDRELITIGVDMQERALYWTAVAWGMDFSGDIIDYGTWPDQRRQYFHLRSCPVTLADLYPEAGIEARLLRGLSDLADDLLGRTWTRDDGTELQAGIALVDANWNISRDSVYTAARTHAHAARIHPSHGRYVGASSMPFADYKRKRGERVGDYWRLPSAAGRKERGTRPVIFDTNYWKSHVHARLATPRGDTGSLNLYGRDHERHRMFAEQCAAEYRVRVEARGKLSDEWKHRPGKPDNHIWDTIVMAAVGASMLGAKLRTTANPTPGTAGASPKARRRPPRFRDFGGL